MEEREFKICTWIHHAATITGLSAGIWALDRRTRGTGRKQSVLKETALVLYIISQIWAAVKIVASLLSGRERMKDSYDNIHSLCNDKQKERGLTWMLTIVSACVKTGMPVMLR
ncbi:hypothetical protein CE91St62_18160 [Lachnospiraceae bacterium]|uniref:hypothetical protein n=1 Tax=Extibacter sp. GGCC_0201 TaxID=2731209 RepID=UPI001AA164B3|nr:hypothetical protein [Extibacter sp. GGCC_0201]MBO1719752.1 hypothetical protein [Extibacter sp. GGCC_0201]BDF33750.1 hypothetical protein CE91St61_18250 [Lachnospiraceae bacterium]BDF37755.1 hypothetical protein CE91St62_18160 [Lachnospiraceae bacterium]